MYAVRNGLVYGPHAARQCYSAANPELCRTSLHELQVQWMDLTQPASVALEQSESSTRMLRESVTKWSAMVRSYCSFVLSCGYDSCSILK
jgi:cob(I)alamin adenosyltransferase